MDKSSGRDGQPYELYYTMPDLFGHLLACVFNNKQQDESIPASVSQKVVVLIRETQTRGTLSITLDPPLFLT